MRIFLSVPSFHPSQGGPAVSVARLAQSLADAGGEVGLWAPDQSAPNAAHISGSPRLTPLTGTAREALAAFGTASVMHDNGIWLRHHHQLAGLAVELRIPRLVSLRGMLEPWARNHKRIKKAVAWALYQRRDLLSAQGLHATAAPELKAVEQLRLGVPVRVIANGIDVPALVLATERRGASEGGQQTALFLGRIHPVKGLPMLVEAWARIRPAGWHLCIAGPDEGGHKAEVEWLVEQHNLTDAVTFLGPLKGADKHAAYAGADLFVLPTHTENFGMAIGEALSYGLPVLTTTGAPWPVLVDQGCGWWVPPTVAGIEEALRAATALPPEALAAMGERSRGLASSPEFSWPGIAKAFLQTYEALASVALDRRKPTL
jgi:glycosyltransferase involved in cell wall biosynthesis